MRAAPANAMSCALPDAARTCRVTLIVVSVARPANIPSTWATCLQKCSFCNAPILEREPHFRICRLFPIENLSPNFRIVDLIVPDFIPFVDEIILGLMTVVLGVLREKRGNNEKKKAERVD